MRPAWVEIHLEALKENIKTLKACSRADVEFIGVVKADGYGHGAANVAEVLKKEGIKYLAVVTLEEGIELREKGFDEPILVLGLIVEEYYAKVLQYKLTPILSRYDHALKLNNIAKEMKEKVRVHIKVDTGMGRLGFIPSRESLVAIKEISRLSNIIIEGIFSHLATADDIKNNYAKRQFDKFINFVDELEKIGVTIPKKHIANSGAIINFPEMHLDMVRLGTSLYGLYPSTEMSKDPIIKLVPAMSIKARLVHIKSIPKDSPVSYSGTFVSKRETLVGVVPMGYVDGIFRQLANKGEVLVQGKRCPMIGNICMDHFMVDLTDLTNVKIGDEVVFLGYQGDERITAEEIASKINTISIEIITRLGKRMPIIYKE